MHAQWLEAVGSRSDLSMSWTHGGVGMRQAGWDRKRSLAVRYQFRGFRSQELRQICKQGSLLPGALLQTGRWLPKGKGQQTNKTHPRAALEGEKLFALLPDQVAILNDAQGLL